MGAATNPDWPALPLSAWADTYATLHLWTQIVGKVRLALAPPVNHWWHVVLYVNARGLTTSRMPAGARSIEIAFDFVGHQLHIDVSDGSRRSIALEPMAVRDFYARFTEALRELKIDVKIWPVAVELPAPIRLDQDRDHASYDARWAGTWWRIMLQVDDVLQQFRGRFLGKSSPVHFFWGGFDLAVTRFSGRRAPARPDPMQQEAYSHEVASAGFWPGSGAVNDAAFYAYAAPEPDGFKTAAVRPSAASYRADMGEYILMYEDVRKSAAPREMLLEFLQSTYEAAANLARWNRAELERTA